MTVKDFINDLGGARAVSQQLNAPYTTVHSWILANRVPAWRMPKLAEIATNNGKPVPASFADKSA